MKMAKKIAGWVIPIVMIAALLTTMNVFKRSENLTPEEQQKIEQYTKVQE